MLTQMELSDYETFRERFDKDTLSTFELLCKHCGTTLEEAHGRSKLKSVIRARAACWAYQKDLGASLPDIGRQWGRDHTTVYHAIVRYHAWVKGTGPASRSVVAKRIELDLLALQLENEARRMRSVASNLEDAAVRLRGGTP